MQSVGDLDPHRCVAAVGHWDDLLSESRTATSGNTDFAIWFAAISPRAG
jgi:hypothetical protein